MRVAGNDAHGWRPPEAKARRFPPGASRPALRLRCHAWAPLPPFRHRGARRSALPAAAMAPPPWGEVGPRPLALRLLATRGLMPSAGPGDATPSASSGISCVPERAAADGTPAATVDGTRPVGVSAGSAAARTAAPFELPQSAAGAAVGGGHAAAGAAGELVQRGELEAAAAKLREAIEQEAHPFRALQSRVNLGCVLHRLGASEHAGQLLADALRRLEGLALQLPAEPQHPARLQLRDLEVVIHVNLSCCSQGRDEERRRHLGKALRLDPSHREALVCLAMMLDTQGQWEDALLKVRLALRSHADDIECLALACRCFDRLGRRDEALEACERICTLDAASTYAALREVFECKTDDLFVVTFPRCGTTWMVQLAVCILHGADADYDLHAVFVEGSIATQPSFVRDLERLPGPRVLKMHVPADAFPGLARCSEVDLQPQGKVVYVVRNPKDALVSLRHHHANNASISWNGTWDEWIDQWLAGLRSAEYGGSYFDHVRCWWRLARLHPDRICIVYFEDMKADLSSAAAGIAEFLGRATTPGEFGRIVDRCSFETMRSKYSVAEDVKHRVNLVHFRRGDVGSWREVLTAGQARRVDEETWKQLRQEIAEGLRIHDLPAE